jgi:hypothetical protein
VLGTGVETVDLLVGGVADEGDLAGVVGLGERRPVLRGLLDSLIAGVLHVQLPARVVVGHRAVGAPGPQVRPRALFVGVERAADVRQLGARGDVAEAREHAPGADRGELGGVADRHEL